METDPQQATSRFKTWWQQNSWPVWTFLVTRLGLLVLVWLSLSLLPVVTGEGFWRAFPNNLFFDGWSRWDSGWYVDIAQNGYSDALQNVYLNTAFFPLYPLLIKGLQYLLGNYHAAGLLVSNLSLLAASVLLYKLIEERFSSDIAQKSLLLLLLNPFAFYFSAVYTESLFLLLVVLVFHFGSRKQWALAALFSALAGATRLVGLLTIIPLLYLYFESVGFKWRKLRAGVLWPALGLLGPGSYMLFQALKFGDPFLFVKSQNAPGWKEGVNLFSALDALRMTFSWDALKTGDFPAVYAAHVLAFLVGLSLLIVTRRKLPTAWWIWALVTLLVSFSVWISMGRFMIVIFPLYIGTTLLFKDRQFNSVLYFSALLLGLFAIMFSHWYWVG
jgi:Gpi18-like mannosyltransferase